MSKEKNEPPLPTTFCQYLRSMGPGIIIVLTWLGAGDLVDAAVAGGNYGYSLMWAMALALTVRFIFVSILAKYQLCNQHGESVMTGFQRIHPALPLFFGVIAFLMGHFYGAYMVKGTGEAFAKAVGFGPPWAWATFWVTLAAILTFKNIFSKVEMVFFLFLGLLSISFIGIALWSGPDPIAVAKGVFLFSIPQDTGSFGVMLIITSLIGAVGGTITNLFYPYFIEKKRWKGPKYRKLQLYDLAFGVCVLIILDLAIWTVGAEILKPTGQKISSIDDLAAILAITLGEYGETIFYLGVFAAVFTSSIGNALGFGFMVGDIADQRKKARNEVPSSISIEKTKLFKFVVVWNFFSPLVWMLPGTPGFVALTIVVNAASVVILPILSGSIWYITSQKRFIGPDYKNKWWEHAVMAFLFILSLWASSQALRALIGLL